MKNYLHHLAKYTALILISSAPFPLEVFAEDTKEPIMAAVAGVEKKSSETRRKILAEKQQQILKEANEALSGTEDALAALAQNDPKKALATLKETSGKLDTILAKNPGLALIPADVEVDILDFDGDAKTIEQQISTANDLLDHGKVQDARKTLAGLVSELRITTTNIPLGSFPGAIKETVTLINAGKTEEAAQVLYEVLNLLEKTTEIIPLHLLRAEEMLTQASELEHKQDLSKEKSREEVLKYAEAAKNQLQLAVLMGYGNKDDYKALYDAINEIKQVIHTQKSASTWEKIKSSLAELKNKVMPAKK